MSFVCADSEAAGSAEYSDAQTCCRVGTGGRVFSLWSRYLDMTDQILQGHFLPTAVAPAVHVEVIPLGVFLSCNLPTDVAHTAQQHTHTHTERTDDARAPLRDEQQMLETSENVHVAFVLTVISSSWEGGQQPPGLSKNLHVYEGLRCFQ